VIAAKVPQVITHEKVLVDCDEDLKHFLETMDELKEKRACVSETGIVLQFRLRGPSLADGRDCGVSGFAGVCGRAREERRIEAN